jgi:hypothetical protein
MEIKSLQEKIKKLEREAKDNEIRIRERDQVIYNLEIQVRELQKENNKLNKQG